MLAVDGGVAVNSGGLLSPPADRSGAWGPSASQRDVRIVGGDGNKQPHGFVPVRSHDVTSFQLMWGEDVGGEQRAALCARFSFSHVCESVPCGICSSTLHPRLRTSHRCFTETCV